MRHFVKVLKKIDTGAKQDTVKVEKEYDFAGESIRYETNVGACSIMFSYH